MSGDNTMYTTCGNGLIYSTKVLCLITFVHSLQGIQRLHNINTETDETSSKFILHKIQWSSGFQLSVLLNGIAQG